MDPKHKSRMQAQGPLTCYPSSLACLRYRVAGPPHVCCGPQSGAFVGLLARKERESSETDPLSVRRALLREEGAMMLMQGVVPRSCKVSGSPLLSPLLD